MLPTLVGGSALVVPQSAPVHRSPRLLRCCAPAMAVSGSAWAEATGVPLAEVAAPYYEVFSELARSAEFVEAFGQQPLLWSEPRDGIAGSFTLSDLQVAVDSDFLDAGRGVTDGKGGWKMAAVSQPRGPSFEEAKMRYCDVEAALAGGTVVFNSAGAHIPKLGAFCLAALDAFELPNCLNLYCTGKGTVTSAPPHTDKQDVFVLQTCGAKHWRVYDPPPPDKRCAAAPSGTIPNRRENDVRPPTRVVWPSPRLVRRLADRLWAPRVPLAVPTPTLSRAARRTTASRWTSWVSH